MNPEAKGFLFGDPAQGKHGGIEYSESLREVLGNVSLSNLPFHGRIVKFRLIESVQSPDYQKMGIRDRLNIPRLVKYRLFHILIN